jgi:hypothetical protein
MPSRMQLEALSRINFRSGFGDPGLLDRLENTFNVSLIGSAVPLKRIPVELIYLGVKIAAARAGRKQVRDIRRNASEGFCASEDPAVLAGLAALGRRRYPRRDNLRPTFVEKGRGDPP